MYVAISLHKIKKTLAQIKAAVLVLDVEQLNPEEVDILMKIAPTDEEVCVYTWVYCVLLVHGYQHEMQSQSSFP